MGTYLTSCTSNLPVLAFSFVTFGRENDYVISKERVKNYLIDRVLVGERPALNFISVSFTDTGIGSTGLS